MQAHREAKAGLDSKSGGFGAVRRPDGCWEITLEPCPHDGSVFGLGESDRTMDRLAPVQLCLVRRSGRDVIEVYVGDRRWGRVPQRLVASLVPALAGGSVTCAARFGRDRAGGVDVGSRMIVGPPGLLVEMGRR